MNENLSAPAYTCPCCGHFSFAEPPGSYDICRVCFWEDDLIQLAFPNCKGGANDVRLTEAQKNFAGFGACDRKFAGKTAPPEDGELLRNPDFRTISPKDRTLDWTSESHKKLWEEYKDEDPNLYYWEKDYWLNDAALIKRLKTD